MERNVTIVAHTSKILSIGSFAIGTYLTKSAVRKEI